MSEPEQPALVLGDRYVMVERLDDEDGHQAWRGHDDVVSRPVLAEIHAVVPAEDDWRDRFDIAARRLEALSHPGIASTLDHDAEAPRPWLVAAAVDGDRVDEILDDDGELTADDAMAIVGQTALALKAAHDAGIAHGSVDPRHIVVRPDGSSALTGFQVPTSRRQADDLAALAALARRLLPATAATDEQVAGFLRWVAGSAATDAGEIGRTALALAAAIRGAHATTVVTTTAPAGEPVEDEPATGERRTWYDEDERKRVRNGLIAIGAIVVIAGAALLFVVNRSGGPTSATVPYVVGETLNEAQKELTQAVLRVTENITDPSAYVTGQSPAGGTRVKVGTLVTLTVSETGP